MRRRVSTTHPTNLSGKPPPFAVAGERRRPLDRQGGPRRAAHAADWARGPGRRWRLAPTRRRPVDWCAGANRAATTG